MDIFTTQLTRVVPNPIKPANLKVKALLKEAATGELKEDLDHIENHDYYFDNDESTEEESQQNQPQENNTTEEQVGTAASALTNDKKTKKAHQETGVTESEDGVKHLDLYV